MVHERVKRLIDPLWRPLLRPVDARFERLLSGLDGVNGRLDKLERSGPADAASVSVIQEQLQALRDDVWHSKAVNVGDRLLVGARHLGLVFLVQADDRLIGPRFVIDGEYEPETTSFMRRTVSETSVCIDVGANFGYFTCLMARLAWRGRTYAFEPDPLVHALLRENVFINWCERLVEPINRAVGDHQGELSLFRRVGRSGNTSIVRSTPEELAHFAEPPSEEFRIGCTTLDAFLLGAGEQLGRVEMVKIDVEGAESLVLKGMTDLVRRHRPTIVMEWSPWQSQRAGFGPDQLIGQLAASRLTPHVLERDGTTQAVTFETLASLDYGNVVLRPDP